MQPFTALLIRLIVARVREARTARYYADMDRRFVANVLQAIATL